MTPPPCPRVAVQRSPLFEDRPIHWRGWTDFQIETGSVVCVAVELGSFDPSVLAVNKESGQQLHPPLVVGLVVPVLPTVDPNELPRFCLASFRGQ